MTVTKSATNSSKTTPTSTYFTRRQPAEMTGNDAIGALHHADWRAPILSRSCRALRVVTPHLARPEQQQPGEHKCSGNNQDDQDGHAGRGESATDDHAAAGPSASIHKRTN